MAMATYQVLSEWAALPRTGAAMPAMFVGHGSPMNGIERNAFSESWSSLGRALPKPRGVVCVSAHWMTRGSRITAMENPETIHDFGGFPRELAELRYPAPGDPRLASLAAETMGMPGSGALDHGWGLDHGAWTVLRRMFPEADVPVVQLSLDWGASPSRHFELGRQLGALRDRGILVIGSGNVVHNLGLVDFSTIGTPGAGFDWALEFDAAVKKAVLGGDDAALIDWNGLSGGAKLAVPTPDHYLPLLYAAGARRPGDDVLVFNEAAIGGSLTMTSYAFG
jgi:4,5-DOPA dioxygenase extradiol